MGSASPIDRPGKSIAFPSLRSPSEPTLRWEQITVLFLALVLGTAAVLCGFFADRHTELDDLGLFNPPYMYANYGSVTYPAHFQFHSMYVHPPLHYWVLGVLMKAGIPPYYAEAVPPLFFLLLGLFFICRSPFPYAVKVGLSLVLWVPLLYFPFGPRMRPEAHMALAWFAGLVLLETGRLQGWTPVRLCVGSFLLTYASCLHYPFSLAWTGVLVYVVWVLRVQRDRRGVVALLALVGGGCAAGIPYLSLFVIPHWGNIAEVFKATNSVGGTLASIRAHLELCHSLYSTVVAQAAWAWPLQGLLWPLKIGLPLIVITLVGLWVSPATRGLALAGLPYPLFLLLVVTRKFVGYLMPEFMLYFAGLGVAACIALDRLASRTTSRRGWLGVFGFGILMSATLAISSPVLRTVKILRYPRVHESALARAAGRQMLGPNALVGSRRAALFYASGGADYFDVELDLLFPGAPSRTLGQAHHPRDLAGYLGLFDAIAETPYVSDWTLNDEKKSLVSWYAEKALHLRGFYFSSQTDALNHLLLNARPTESVQGYGLAQDGRAVHFQQWPGGNYVFVAVTCDAGDFPGNPPTQFSVVFNLPNPGTEARKRELHTFISAAEDYHVYRQLFLQKCSFRDEIQLREELVDVQALLATLADDKPIRFPETLEQAVEERYGPALQVRLASDSWPYGFTAPSAEPLRSLAEPLPPGDYALSGKSVQEIFRSDMESLSGWRANRYGQWGGFDIVPDGLARGDASGKYSVGDGRDHLITEYLKLPKSKAGFVFFSLWVKKVAAGDLPHSYLQDENYSALADARPVIRRADGWTLLAGVAPASSGQKVRLVVQQVAGSVCLLDKALVVVLSPRSR